MHCWGRDWWELPLFYKGHWQSPCTALMAGKCLPLGLCKETVKKCNLVGYHSCHYLYCYNYIYSSSSLSVCDVGFIFLWWWNNFTEKALFLCNIYPLLPSVLMGIVVIYYMPCFNEVERGVFWFHLVHLSICPPSPGVVTRQNPHINGSVVLGADESPWPCGTPSWYTPLSWMILSKQKNLHLFSSQYICVFSKTSVCLIKKGFTINRLKNTMKKCLRKHSWIEKKYSRLPLSRACWEPKFASAS